MRPKPLIPILTDTQVSLFLVRGAQLCSRRDALVFWLRGRPDEPWPVGTQPGYDSTSRPFVCLRATSSRWATFSQFAMFHAAFT